MATRIRNYSRLSLRIPAELKHTIEVAATISGRSISDFAISVFERSARLVIEEHDCTVLTNRDRDAFVALLDQTDAKPNKALAAAARRYKKRQDRLS